MWETDLGLLCASQSSQPLGLWPAVGSGTVEDTYSCLKFVKHSWVFSCPAFWNQPIVFWLWMYWKQPLNSNLEWAHTPYSMYQCVDMAGCFSVWIWQGTLQCVHMAGVGGVAKVCAYGLGHFSVCTWQGTLQCVDMAGGTSVCAYGKGVWEDQPVNLDSSQRLKITRPMLKRCLSGEGHLLLLQRTSDGSATLNSSSRDPVILL